MMLDQRTLQNHYNLSYECGTLTRALCEDDGAPRLQMDLRHPGMPPSLRDYEYAVSPWPILISAQTKEAFARVVREIPPLIRRAIVTFYEHDRAAFTAHYNLSDIVYQLLADTSGEPTHIPVRHDLVLRRNQPKLLELNVGSKIGGWEISWLWRQLAEMIGRRNEARDWHVSHTSAGEAFLRHVHAALHAHVGAAAPSNVLVVIEPEYLERRSLLELAAIYDRIVVAARGRGRLMFDVDLGGVAVDGDRQVRHRGEVVGAVLIPALGPRLTPELVRAHISRRVFLPDTPLYTILGRKTNFALLHALRAAGRLSDHDARLVDEYIPWSALLTDGTVEWAGARHSVRSLAWARKDDLVLKPGMSFQGKDVFVGRFVSDEEWAAALERAGTNGQWVLQEYCAPDRLYAPDGEDGVTEHEAVWGVFGFGSEYGGTFGRLLKANTGQGVVNSARGALECVILEV